MAQALTGSGVYWGRSPIVTRPVSPVPVPVPVTSSMPAPATPPVAASPVITAPRPAPVLLSPISGNAIQSSIFQPSHTTAVIETQALAGPDTGFSMLTDGAAPAPLAMMPAAETPTGFLGLDQNTWLVLLVVLAAIIVMVMS